MRAVLLGQRVMRLGVPVFHPTRLGPMPRRGFRSLHEMHRKTRCAAALAPPDAPFYDQNSSFVMWKVEIES